MICEELEREITSETCAAMKRHSWCDKSCEERKVILKAPQSLPEIIDQDSQISEITPKEVQSTQEEAKTIVGHSGKPKGKILGRCEKRGEDLTWGGCLQRKRNRHPVTCRDCDQSPFQFSEPPRGRGWHNSAARAGEMECPELDGRKLKKSTCIMRQGKRRKAGKSCDCQFWKGEKMEKPSAMRSLVTMWCPTCQAERAGWTNQKTHCGECEAELEVRQPAPEPITYFCPECGNPVVVEGSLCNSCYKQMRSAVAEEVKPAHIHLIGVSEKLMRKITAHERGMQEIRKMTESMQSLAAEILDELQKAVKEVEGV